MVSWKKKMFVNSDKFQAIVLDKRSSCNTEINVIIVSEQIQEVP